MTIKTHSDYMEYCLVLAEKALSNGNPPVGAILVYRNEVIGEGIESGKSTSDITNHAEINAIRNAIQKGKVDFLSDSIMYTTHEPCIMCSYVIRHHKISKIVFGTEVQFVGGCTSKLNVLTTDAVPKWGTGPEIIKGVLKDRCDILSKKFENSLK